MAYLGKSDVTEWLNNEVVNDYFRYPIDNRDANKWYGNVVRGRQAFYNSFFLQTLFDKRNHNRKTRIKYDDRQVKNGGDFFTGR